MASIFPATSLAATANQTAKHTNQLHPIARAKAEPQVRLTFPLAMAKALAPTAKSVSYTHLTLPTNREV